MEARICLCLTSFPAEMLSLLKYCFSPGAVVEEEELSHPPSARALPAFPSSPAPFDNHDQLCTIVPLLAPYRQLDSNCYRQLRLVSKETRISVDTYAICSLCLSGAPCPEATTPPPISMATGWPPWSSRLLSRLLSSPSPRSSPTLKAQPYTKTVQEGLMTAMRIWPSLSHLYLTTVTIDDLRTLNTQSFKKLQGVELSVQTPDSPTQDGSEDGLYVLMTDPGAKHWVRLLKSFTARSHSTMTSLLPLSHSTRLISLDLSSCSAVSDLAPLSSCILLKDLRLSNCSLIHSLSPLTHCSKITYLDLSGCEGITSLSPLSSLPDLSILLLAGCHKINDLSPLSSCSIEHLDISHMRLVSDLSPIASPKLQKLNLQSCTSVLDLSPLSDHCQNLISINLKGCSRQQDRNLLVACSKLARLMVVGLNHATGEIFALQLFIWEGKLN